MVGPSLSSSSFLPLAQLSLMYLWRVWQLLGDRPGQAIYVSKPAQSCLRKARTREGAECTVHSIGDGPQACSAAISPGTKRYWQCAQHSLQYWQLSGHDRIGYCARSYFERRRDGQMSRAACRRQLIPPFLSLGRIEVIGHREFTEHIVMYFANGFSTRPSSRKRTVEQEVRAREGYFLSILKCIIYSALLCPSHNREPPNPNDCDESFPLKQDKFTSPLPDFFYLYTRRGRSGIRRRQPPPRNL